MNKNTTEPLSKSQINTGIALFLPKTLYVLVVPMFLEPYCLLVCRYFSLQMVVLCMKKEEKSV